MIEPGPDALLAGVADSLERTVLPDLTSGPLRRQVREAIRVVRRVALVMDRIAPALHEDVADMAATLRATVGPREHEPAWRALRSRLDELAAPDETEAASLRRHHAALQDLLIEVDAAIHALPDPAARAAALTRLRALYRRMLLRERGLTRPGSA